MYKTIQQEIETVYPINSSYSLLKMQLKFIYVITYMRSNHFIVIYL